MRPGLELACLLLAVAASAAGAVVACAGPAFVNAPSDGGPPAGGGAPDAPAADASGESFCLLEAGMHMFCDDFDSLPLVPTWNIDQAGGGVVAIDSTRSYSPPNSLMSTAPASNGFTRGRVLKTFGSGSNVVVALELWVDAAPPKLVASEVGVAGDSLVGIGVGPSYSIGLSAHDVVGYFEDNTGDAGVTVVRSSKDFTLQTAALEEKWTEVVIEVDLANAALSITIGGVEELVGAPITPPTAGTEPITVDLGCYAHNETAELAAHFDNVTIDIP
jgi:hypothetical protein